MVRSALLSQYEFEISHLPGDKMRHVDVLSLAQVNSDEQLLDGSTWPFVYFKRYF